MKYKVDFGIHTIEMTINDVANVNGEDIRLDDVREAKSPDEDGGTAFLINLTTGKSMMRRIVTDTPVFNDIRSQLSKLRGKVNQSEVAEKAHLSVVTISRVENMTQSITTEKLERWLNAIGYTLKIEKL